MSAARCSLEETISTARLAGEPRNEVLQWSDAAGSAGRVRSPCRSPRSQAARIAACFAGSRHPLVGRGLRPLAQRTTYRRAVSNAIAPLSPYPSRKYEAAYWAHCSYAGGNIEQIIPRFLGKNATVTDFGLFFRAEGGYILQSTEFRKIPPSGDATRSYLSKIEFCSDLCTPSPPLTRIGDGVGWRRVRYW